MSKQFFDVTVRCTHDALPNFLTTIGKGTSLISVVPVEPATPEPTAKRTQRYINGKRNKGISAHNLLVMSLREPKTVDELAQILTDRGFAATSLSPSLSILRSKGLIYEVGGKYHLTHLAPRE